MRDNIDRSRSFVPLAVRPLLERISSAPSRFLLLVLAAFFVPLAALAPRSVLHAQPLITSSYDVLSVTPQEVVIRIHPKYESQVVRDTSGYTYTEMTFPGGVITDSAGSREIMRIPLEFLTPGTQPAQVKILSQSLEVVPNIDLAPVPTSIRRNGDILEQYIVKDRYYTARESGELFHAGAVHEFRTAYSEKITISPISYDPGSRSVTRVKSLTLSIRFSGAALDRSSVAPAVPAGFKISSEEAGLFRALFINGGITSLYSGALQQNPREWAISTASKSVSEKGVSALSSSDGGQWIEVTTSAEGIYRITAQDLANAGITGTVDPSTIELFGVGGAMLNEAITPTSGDWLQQPIEVRANGENFSELYFYAPGVSVWKYSSDISGTNGLYHTLNPYTSSGHFLLKIGGEPIDTPLRVTTSADSLLQPAIPSDQLLAATVHEQDHTLEYGDVGREMLDQDIPRDGAPPLQITLDAPGYRSSGPAMLRVAWDSKIPYDNTGYVNVQVNGQSVGKIEGRILDSQASSTDIDRNWDHPLFLDPSVQAPLNLTLTFTSGSIIASATLDFAELVYARGTDIGSQSIPFMLVDTGAALQYQFTNASGGEIWDVTNALAPAILASADGNSMTVSLQGRKGAMRRFLAFSGQSAISPTLAKIAAPSLRTTICQTGATEIIVAPEAFRDQANELAQLREEGGQATEPMSAAVVTIEDIYREFGYGNPDIVALRDFMAYTFHHAKTRPVYLTLLGNGHCDYQLRETSAPDWLPAYEVGESGSLVRSGVVSEPYPDDDFFVNLTPGAPDYDLDLAVGRVSARNKDDATTYVQKVQEYEHASDTGSWRALGTFLADDHWDPEDDGNLDLLEHLFDTENEISHLQDRVLVHKIYEVSYPTVISSDGKHTKPEVNQAIIDAFNTGTMLFSFVGHGNPNVWTHEGVLTVPASIDAMTNFDRLAYVTTATCDFSSWDDFGVFSGGEQFLMSPTGGAIGVLGTSRAVTGGEPLVQNFYQTLFQQDSGKGTSTVGEALLAGKRSGGDYQFFYLLGDPAQRLLLPKLYVSFDSLDGRPLAPGDPTTLSALSEARISGSIRDGSTGAAIDPSFTGTVTVSLYDTPTKVSATSIFPILNPPDTVVDHYSIEGPILFRGTATVTNGTFTINFVVPRDIKLDSGAAKLSGYAYSSADGRTALGDNTGIQLQGDSALTVKDTTGPSLQLWIGNRSFRSGDDVSMHTTAIVDVKDLHGLNTSTASIGHSFIAWVDNAQDSAIDMASTYVSQENDYTRGTSIHAIELPAGHHTLHVRAFDTFDNPSFASVDFNAKTDAPYQLYDVTTVPNPIHDHTTFSFVQPGQAGSLVNATLSLYTTDGRLVRSLAASSRQSVIEIPWDGRDANGSNVANGIYVFTVNVQDATDGTSSLATGKCVVAR